MAVAALAPLSVAVSVTAVPVGTLMLVPLCPPPDSEVDNDVDCGVVVDGAEPSPGLAPESPGVGLMKNGCDHTCGCVKSPWLSPM